MVQQFLRIIDEQADHMHSLIDDLLDAGRIEAGTLAVGPEPTEVASLVEQARNMFLSGEGRHTVQIDLPPGLPRVMADRGRIVQVLTNLLSNAARHSPESSPIRVAAERKGVHVAISVSDKGQGVPLDQLPHLFRKYARGGGDRGIRGSGLGLSICKGLVEAHGGRIRAESGGPAGARGSPSRFQWRKTRRPASPGALPARLGKSGNEPASWWWTTTRRRSATCGTRWRTPATPLW